MSKVEAIINFWFDGITGPEQLFGAISALWFDSTEDFNNKIRSDFLADIDKAIAGEYDEWLSSPRGCLAMIILLDQFTRNMFPSTIEQIKGDNKAISVAEHLIQQGFEAHLWPVHLGFAYLPFEHSEEPKYQELSVRKFTELVDRCPENLKEEARGSFVRFALLHKQVIDRFGRYPGRNYYMGRVSTEEEEKYLKEDDFGF
jgi:uncharacterized protein (DUF924 family)